MKNGVLLVQIKGNKKRHNTNGNQLYENQLYIIIFFGINIYSNNIEGKSYCPQENKCITCVDIIKCSTKIH
jgi:hypothetical protein